MTQDAQVSAEAAPVPADSTPAGTGACPGEDPAAAAWRDAIEPAPLPAYLAMFREYIEGQDWIGPAERPLVFHLERLCIQLDANPAAPAAVSSAYLQAFSRLDRRRPGGAPGPAEDPAQTSIFDELD